MSGANWTAYQKGGEGERREFGAGKLAGMGDPGRMLVGIGGLILVLGLVLMLAGRINLPIGRLPGDIVVRGKNTTFYFPLMTSIVLSVLLSLVLYVVGRMRR